MRRPVLASIRAAGYQGKTLFRPDAVQQITFYSNGIPRLVNIICDNALLCAFARSQKIVVADIVNEVAHDLRLVAEGNVAGAQVGPGLPASVVESASIHNTTKHARRRKGRRLLRAGVEAVLAICAALSVATPAARSRAWYSEYAPKAVKCTIDEDA